MYYVIGGFTKSEFKVIALIPGFIHNSGFKGVNREKGHLYELAEDCTTCKLHKRGDNKELKAPKLVELSTAQMKLLKLATRYSGNLMPIVLENFKGA